MQGGLARRVTFIDRARTGGDKIIVVDSGRFYPDIRTGDTVRAKLKAELIGRIYRRMAMSAVNISDWELQSGVAFLKREAAKGLPLTSASITDSQGKLLFPAYKIKKMENLRFGFFGLMRPEVDQRLLEKEGIKIKDPIAAANETVALLKKRADIIILLSDLGQEIDARIASQVSGIHFIIDSRDGVYGYPQKLRDSFLLMSNKDGKGIGKLRIVADNASEAFMEDQEDRVRQQIRDLDANIQSFQKNPSRHVESDRMLAQMRNQRTQLQLKIANPPPRKGNYFSWVNVPLEKDMTEDRAVAEWIRKAGFEKD